MEEQLRDMTFHFESQIKILQAEKEGGDGSAMSDLTGGAVIAPDTPSPSSNARGKRRAKKG